MDPHTLVTSVSAALREASRGLPVAHIRTMDEIEVRNTSRQRFNMLLLTIFGGAGLLMAAIGVYGVMSYSVQQRTQELGIRMALGAQTSDLRDMVVGQGMTLTLIVFIATPLLLTVVALIAIWIPAKRATRVDPMTALRLE
jgi:putative ABC transport system permease protein